MAFCVSTTALLPFGAGGKHLGPLPVHHQSCYSASRQRGVEHVLRVWIRLMEADACI